MDQKTLATKARSALLAHLLLVQTATAEDVKKRLKNPTTPKPHVEGAQFIVRGSGCATAQFDPDGNAGDETDKSIDNIYATADATE